MHNYSDTLHSSWGIPTDVEYINISFRNGISHQPLDENVTGRVSGVKKANN